MAAAMFVAVPAFAANTNTACNVNSTDTTAVSGISYKVNGVPAADLNGLNRGDHVVVSFTTTGNCTEVSFASYLDTLAIPTSGNPDLSNQGLSSSDTSGSGGFGAGAHTLAIDIPCQYQADFVIGAVIPKFTATVIYGPRVISTGFGSSSCTTPTPTPTESIQSTVTPSATSNVQGATTTNPAGGVSAAAVTAPNTGNGTAVLAGFITLLMVLTGIAILAETRRRRINS